jgi:hypothetical protein
MMEAKTILADTAFASNIDLAIPENMGIAHRAVLYDLWDVMGMGGTGSKAARGLAERLTAHFAREEELIGSIFSLSGPDEPFLPGLPDGPSRPENEDIAIMTDYLESELRDLRNEHDEFRPDIDELKEIAEASFDHGLHDLALRLEAHLSLEENVHFPAAIYVGKRLMDGTGGRDDL